MCTVRGTHLPRYLSHLLQFYNLLITRSTGPLVESPSAVNSRFHNKCHNLHNVHCKRHTFSKIFFTFVTVVQLINNQLMVETSAVNTMWRNLHNVPCKRHTFSKIFFIFVTVVQFINKWYPNMAEFSAVNSM